ncbi:MAG: hypothetical protein K2X64_09815 [Rhodocyclaceae bacterium]|nr:hypothetical protein [Rhodocyclaceae bacterium]
MHLLKHTLRNIATAFIGAAMLAAPVLAQTSPKIAVTDLSYEERVAIYFQNINYQSKQRYNSSARENYRDSNMGGSGSASARESGSSDVSFSSSTGYQMYIDRGELRKFTADVKGELLKSGYRVVQGKPWTATNTEKLYDIIGRIKQGYYAGADYVLWGTVTNIEYRRDDTPIQGSNAFSHQLALELVVEYSLISTKNYEIKAAFSAMGEGNDTKMTNAPGARVTLNRSKVMQEVSRSLGTIVAQEIEGQFGAGASPSTSARGNRDNRGEAPAEEKVIIFK